MRYGPAANDLAIVYTHGITSSVFRPTHVGVGRALERDGCTVIAGNNRGTGLATVFPRRDGSRALAGSWFERLGDAAIDIAAWMDVAASGGASRLVLLGHSLGAAKAVLYASERRDQRLASLVLASPAFHLVSRQVDPEAVAPAQAAVADGRPDALIDAPHEVAFRRMSAATLIDYATGRANPWDEAAPRLSAISCPILAFYGTAEPEVGGQAELERIGKLVRGPFSTHLIDGANHMYVGHEDKVAAVVVNWLRAVVLPSLARESTPAG
ncbi:MAG TPA: alpha/beta hydrolase [Candidatus Limnocylindria bacterium]|nr:alpha/beta hydrolase [Candidatus Limnocylindria bacterium]